MTSVGLVGGIGPESTIDYYRRILAAWEREAPGTSPSIVIDSLDVRLGLRLVEKDRPAFIEYLVASVQRLAAAGVDFVAMTANTPHVVFDEITARATVPLLSIVETCAEEASRRGLTRLALFGTRFTMEAPMYPDVFARSGMAVIAPNDAERALVHDRYVNQLLNGEFRDDTRQEFIALIGRLRDEEKIDGVILGGTELTLLLKAPVLAGIPALDTTALHVAAIVDRLRGRREAGKREAGKRESGKAGKRESGKAGKRDDRH
jgi:aspartate racemase